MIITPFGRDLPDHVSRPCTQLPAPFLPRRETRGPQRPIHESLARLLPEVHQTSRKRSTRLPVLGFPSLSRIAAGGKESSLRWRFL